MRATHGFDAIVYVVFAMLFLAVLALGPAHGERANDKGFQTPPAARTPQQKKSAGPTPLRLTQIKAAVQPLGDAPRSMMCKSIAGRDLSSIGPTNPIADLLQGQ